MRTQQVTIQAFKLELWPVNVRKKADEKYCTHLAINIFGHNAVIVVGKNYDHEAGQARNGIDLPRDRFRLGKLKVGVLSPRTHIVHR